jgi:hypothetical protein
MIDDLLYILVAIVVGMALALNFHLAPKEKVPVDTRFPTCFVNVCFS